MKNVLFVPILWLCCIILVSCGKIEQTVTVEDNPYYKRWIQSEMNIDDWLDISSEVPGYKGLNNINPGKIKEIKADIDFFEYNDIMEKTKDGFLHITMKTVPGTGTSQWSDKKIPLIRKLSSEGKIKWEKEYDYLTVSGYITNLIVYPDDGFLFSMQVHPYYTDNKQVVENSILARCNSMGDMVWTYEFPDISGAMLKKVLVGENDEIYVVGDWGMKDGVQTQDEVCDSIVVTKFDGRGNLIEQKGFGGSDFDNVENAWVIGDGSCLLPEGSKQEPSPIVIQGYTQSHDGDFAIGDEGRQRSGFIACITENMNVKWVFFPEEDIDFNSNPFICDEGINLLCYERTGNDSFPGSLQKVGIDGQLLKKTDLYHGMWGHFISGLSTGDIVAGAGRQNDGIIIIMDSNGNEKKRLDNLQYEPQNIFPINDGGFIITSTRAKKSVPQPPLISSIWYDTELLVVKYDNQYKIEWRKTYDRYVGQMGLDFAWPQKDGSILVP